MAKIDHPNVLRCYAFGEYKGLQYFAMEYVDGGSLESWMKKLGRLSVGDAVHVVLACAHALGHAHEMGLIHRDVKPDNILLTTKGVVKVADLGLAKATSEDMGLTKTGTGAGTPLYMSPEQCRDVKHVDARTDIYALGCMLYYFLTGEVPFKGETVVELYEAKAKGKFPPSRQFNDEVPERLDLIIDKTVAQKVELRYQTCAELIADLEKLGLANAYLSFLHPEGSEPPKLGLTPSAPLLPKTVVVPKKPTGAGPKPPARPGTAAKPSAKPSPPADAWFVSYRNSDDKMIKRQMTTAQVLQYIKEDYFDPKAQASRSMEGPYRLLATYGEFESALRGKVSKIKADRKTVKFQAMYKQLEKEQVQRERYRWFRNLFRSFAGWVMLLFWLAALAALGVVLYLLFKYFLKDWIGNWLQKLTQ
jgi:serine/threonine-protein kinase